MRKQVYLGSPKILVDIEGNYYNIEEKVGREIHDIVLKLDCPKSIHMLDSINTLEKYYLCITERFLDRFVDVEYDFFVSKEDLSITPEKGLLSGDLCHWNLDKLSGVVRSIISTLCECSNEPVDAIYIRPEYSHVRMYKEYFVGTGSIGIGSGKQNIVYVE